MPNLKLLWIYIRNFITLTVHVSFRPFQNIDLTALFIIPLSWESSIMSREWRPTFINVRHFTVKWFLQIPKPHRFQTNPWQIPAVTLSNVLFWFFHTGPIRAGPAWSWPRTLLGKTLFNSIFPPPTAAVFPSLASRTSLAAGFEATIRLSGFAPSLGLALGKGSDGRALKLTLLVNPGNRLLCSDFELVVLLWWTVRYWGFGICVLCLSLSISVNFCNF